MRNRSFPFDRSGRTLQRSGFAMLLLLITATAMSVIGVGLFNSIRIESIESKVLNSQTQADLIANSGFELAAAALKADPNFRGNLPMVNLNQNNIFPGQATQLNVSIRDAGNLLIVNSTAQFGELTITKTRNINAP